MTSSASAAASSAAETAKCTSFQVRRTSFAGIAFDGSKSLTSAAMLTGKSVASNDRITSTPLCPATSASQVDRRSFPTGVTAPSPVMATRRIEATDGTPPGRVASEVECAVWRR